MKKIFTIQTCGSRQYVYFFAGKNEVGEQFLICPLGKEVVAVSFHPDGQPLGWKVRDLSAEFVKIKSAPDANDPHPSGRSRSNGSLRCEQLVCDTVFGWSDELGVAQCPIQVRAFKTPGWRIAVEEYPDFLADYKASREDGLDDELEEALNRWESKGMFELWVGRDYYMFADGTVEST